MDSMQDKIDMAKATAEKNITRIYKARCLSLMLGITFVGFVLVFLSIWNYDAIANTEKVIYLLMLSISEITIGIFYIVVVRSFEIDGHLFYKIIISVIAIIAILINLLT